jgi:type IV pilus assembly protein PilE
MKPAMKLRSAQAAFSLVELMIAVLILAIVMSIAIPSYQSHLEKSRRSEGKALLSEIAALQESFRTEQNRYTADLTELGYPAAAWNQSTNGYYRASVLAPSAACPIASCFQLEAQPVAGSAQANDEWTYQLWSDGRKRRAGDSGVWITDWKK